jgi:hypothetical protein
LSLVTHILGNERCARTLKEMALGRLVYMMQFRRPCMAGLARVWPFLRRWGQQREVPRDVEEDLLIRVALLPLMYMDFRLPVSSQATCSDASPTGCGVMVSKCVTVKGQELAGQLKGPRAGGDNRSGCLLVISLFDGIGGARRSLEVARISVYGCIAAESDPDARRVVEAAWPDTACLDDVRKVDEEFLVKMTLKSSRTTWVLVCGGLPCQEFSRLNRDRKGYASERGSLCEELPRVRRLAQRIFRCPVDLFGECVVMSKEELAVVNKVLECEPFSVCASGVAWCRRPRLYWMS